MTSSALHFRPSLAFLWLLAIVVLLGSSPLVLAKVSNSDLQNEYRDKVLILRQPYIGDQLHFGADGKLSSAAKVGPWTIYSQVRVKDISLEGNIIQIRAQRMFLFYDDSGMKLRDLQSVTKGDRASHLFDMKKVEKWAKETTRIEIECAVSEPEIGDVERAMDAVSLAGGEPLSNVVPDYWKNWLIESTPGAVPRPAVAASPDGSAKPPEIPPSTEANGIQRPGPGVKPPRARYTPDPSYSEVANAARYQPTCVLWLIVGPDGAPRNVRIARPVGLGLDEKAVQTVQSWRFDPATKDGKPVAVQINVEITFRLY